ncbi:TPA: DUF4956 domain-containing protein [Candidatus Delongbacteria bacterium]|nr:DUF4956 domain-containing protein [Candidatus Delongbacteria bacterium]
MTQSFEQFLTTTSANITLFAFVLNLLLSAVLSVALSWLYTKYGNSMSNRKQFGKNFLLITMTTMLIITVVKSSLALSLGLVGALSIIRFRAAIKEPEELAYLFLSISIGLGLGADQTGITTIAFLIIMLIVIFSKKMSGKYNENQNLFITVQSQGTTKINLQDIIEVLKRNCDIVNLRRFDETKDALEASLMVEAGSFEQINKAKLELQKFNESVKITFLDNKGLM